MLLKVKKSNQKKSLSINEFYNKRNKVLLVRNARGIGDILTCRMLFKAFKDVIPDCHLTFACFPEYKELLLNHPYLDEVIDYKDVELKDYGISYDISSCCIVYESKKYPRVDKARVDIWADHCGVKISDYDMYAPFIDNEVILGCQLGLNQLRSASLDNKRGKSVLISPIAFEVHRSLLIDQIHFLVNTLKERGLFVFILNNYHIDFGVPVITARNLSEWMGYINVADYVISVDTAAFHYAGGIKKPLMGIFTSVDGKLRGKYYDFVLVQKHRDNGNWSCGPCYAHTLCTKCHNPGEYFEPKACLTELTNEEIGEGVDKLLSKYSI